MAVKHTTPYGAGPTKIGGSQWDEAHTSDSGEFPTTGDFKFVMRQSAPAGWVAAGTTIGDAGSGATRANNDTFSLFAVWWSEYTDAQLPIQTSAGAASTRGASAFADWSALKRLTVFANLAGRFPRVIGTVNGLTIVNGTAYADTLKDHTHLTPQTGSAGGSAPRFTFVANDGAKVLVTDSPSTGAALETAPVSIGMLGCFKL